MFPGGESDLIRSHGLLPPRTHQKESFLSRVSQSWRQAADSNWPLPSLCPRPADRPGAEGHPPPHAGPPHHNHRQEEARLLQRLSAEVQLAGEQSLLSWWWWAWMFKGQKDSFIVHTKVTDMKRIDSIVVSHFFGLVIIRLIFWLEKKPKKQLYLSVFMFYSWFQVKVPRVVLWRFWYLCLKTNREFGRRVLLGSGSHPLFFIFFF